MLFRSSIATVPAGFQLKPIDAYHRRHRTFPAKGLMERITNRLQDVVEAVTEAELSLQKVTAVRDRVISAYQEIMRMPI